jgi:hypothetical protein
MILSLGTFPLYIIFRLSTTSKYEQLFAAALQSSTPKYRGRYTFSGAWSLYNFWGPLSEKGYKITNRKLGLKVNIYLEWEITTNYKFKKKKWQIPQTSQNTEK